MRNRARNEADSEFRQAAEFLRAARHIVVLTGAGVSAESGVPTFRGADGLWEGHAIEDVATPLAFHRDPQLVWSFYNARRANLATVEPNAGHVALAMMEANSEGRSFAVITQNVDGLHTRAGSCNVMELHGNLSQTRCTGCGQVEDRGNSPLGALPRCPECHAILRPNVVWFMESLDSEIWEKAERAAENCDCMLVVGTSAIVFPAAGLVAIAHGHAGKVIECNITTTAASHLAHVRLIGPAAELLPGLQEDFLKK